MYKRQKKEELMKLVNDNSEHLGSIDTSLITDMSSLFRFSDRKDFSGIENWDVSEVTNMSEMFSGAENFNQDLNNWDVSNVKNADWMFCNAKKYRGSMKNWNFSNSMDHEPEDFLKECIIWSMYNGPNDLPSLPFMQSKQRRMSPPEPGIIFHEL